VLDRNRRVTLHEFFQFGKERFLVGAESSNHFCDQRGLHSYTGGADGAIPEDGLVRDASGNLYGTTAYGGAHNGAGVVFKQTP